MSAATPLDQPRAIGAAKVSTKTGPHGSCIDGLRQSGALKLLFPHNKTHVEATVINTAGGITGGDHFDVRAAAGSGSKLTVTTQAAERVYKAQANQTGRLRTRLVAERDATLFWLPQETILYDRSALDRRLRVNLDRTSRFLMVEPILFGRRAMGEDVDNLRFRDHIDIRCNDRPIYRDGVFLKGPVAQQLDRPAIGNGARALASIVWHAPNALGQLKAVRDLLPASAGASMLSDNLMVMRLLAKDGYLLRRCLLPVLDLLTLNTLPQCWRL